MLRYTWPLTVLSCLIAPPPIAKQSTSYTVLTWDLTEYSECYTKLDLIFHSKPDVPSTLHNAAFISGSRVNYDSPHVMHSKETVILDSVGVRILGLPRGMNGSRFDHDMSWGAAGHSFSCPRFPPPSLCPFRQMRLPLGQCLKL